MSSRFMPEPTKNQKAWDSRLVSAMAPYVAAHKRLFVGMILLAPTLTVLQIIRPYLIKILVDDALPSNDITLLLWLTGAYAATMLAEIATLFAQTYGLQYLGLQIIRRLRSDLFDKVLRQSHAYWRSRSSGVWLTRLTSDLEAVGEFFASGVVTLLSDIVKLFVIAGILLSMNVRMTIAAFVAIPVLWLLGIFFRSRLRYAYREIRVRMAKLNGFLSESLDAIETVRNIDAAEPFAARMQSRNEAHRVANMNSIVADASLYSVVEALGSVAIAGLLWYGGGLLVRQEVSFGELIAFIEYIAMFFAPIRDLSQKYAIMQSAMASMERVNQVLEDPIENSSGDYCLPDGLDGAESFAFNNVTFGYNAGEPILRGVSIAAKKGEVVAIVGATGSGKSTMIRLLSKQYDCWEGEILVNGTNVQAWDMQALRAQIAVVHQDVRLLSGTLRENITLHDDSVNSQLVESVCEYMQLSSFIGDLDAPIDMRVSLSDGEKQLLALARALVRKPTILILDEATSQVDAELEELLHRSATKFTNDGIVVSIAHRLATVKDATCIYVLSHGQVIEQGTHIELIGHGGNYADLVALQSLDEALGDA